MKGIATMKILLSLLLLSAFTMSTFAGELYKWVDENGNVQFTQTPPPNTVQDVETRALPETSGSAQNAATTAPPTPEDDTDTSESTTDAANTDNPEKAAMQASKEENCKRALEEQTMLSSNDGRLVVSDPNNPDNFVPLSEEQRQQRLQRAEAFVSTYCNEPAQ